MNKIVLIGPVYPYKGGISHYTGLMYRELSRNHDVYMMSYSLQYPKLLFKKEQRDYSNDSFKIDNTDFCINTANPASWLHAAHKIKHLCPDLIIIQWWHPYFSPCYTTLCSFLAKFPKLFVCHNVFPHERFPLDRFLTKTVLSKGSYYIVQSSQDEHDLLTINPKAVYRRTVHPTYNAFKMQNISYSESRRLLNRIESDKIILFFGFVREYKGLKYLLNAMPQVISTIGNVYLYVVGDFADDKQSYINIINALDIGANTIICDGYIPDREVEKYFAASDVVVLPYTSATQSGIAQIAYGFEKPVIATNVGGLPEVVTEGQTGHIVEPCDSDAIAGAIIHFFSEEDHDSFRIHIRNEAYKYSWARMSEIIDSFLNKQ